MTLLALCPCDLTGFDPRQHLRRWLHRRYIFVVVWPNIELLAEFVRRPSTRVAASLRVPHQLRIKCLFLILRRRISTLPWPRNLNELTVDDFNLVDSLGLETTRRTLRHPRRF